ncbi:MAG: RNA methyltransferase [Pseudomonadota bacterium]
MPTPARRDLTNAIDGPAFVLVEPQMGENIGAVARAMWNFGLADLRIVNPRDGWPNPRAVAMASGATALLDAARISTTTVEACQSFSTVYATTARPREMTKAVFTPEAAARDAAERLARGEKVAILFGRERTGLENHDVVLANAIITVPTNPVFPSLNLAQCSLLMAAEFRRASQELSGQAPPDVSYETGDAALAEIEDVERLYAHLEGALTEANYFWPPDKAEPMRSSLRNLLSRTPLTEQDVRMLRGVIRALSETRRRRDDSG